MKAKKIKVLSVEPHKKPVVIEIDNDYETFRKCVGDSYIECIHLSDSAIMVCDEEGKLNGAEPNRYLWDDTMFCDKDVICGPFFIVGDDGEEFKSLSKEDLYFWLKYFKDAPVINPSEVVPKFEIYTW